MKRNKKNKKSKLGFTLIEVLTVISVLAVIALITLPIISNLVEKSRREAFADSVINGMKSLQSELAANDFEDFPTSGVGADSDKTGLEKNPFTSGLYKKPASQTDIYASKVTDGRYCATGYKTDLEIVLGPCYLLDKTAPEVTLIAGTITSRSIQVVAKAVDEESDIVSYQFSKDNGATWTAEQSGNSYNFDMLLRNTSFTIKVRVKNENNLVTEKAITLKTNNIDVPTYTSNPPLTTWSTSKVITITYPTRQTYFIYEYTTNGGSTWNTVASGTTQNVTFNTNGTLIARVRDGYNTVSASTLTITTIDTTAPGIPTANVKYDSSSGSARSNSSAWTNRTLWWGNYSATDSGSGIARYEYSTNCSGSSSGTLSSSGYAYASNLNVSYCIRAVDNAGNASGWSSPYYFNIDKTAPSCSTSGGGGWTASNLTIKGTCSDTGGSGCTSTVPTRAFSGTTSGTYSPGSVSDNAGNTTSCPTTGVYIDQTPPSCSTSGGGGWTTSGLTVYGTCSDSHSGCKTGQISRGFSGTTSGSYSPGTVSDAVGNTTSCPATGVYIDNTPPLSPKFLDFKIVTVGSVTSNGCGGVGGTASNASCDIYVRAPRGGTGIVIEHYFDNIIDQHSGYAKDQYIWTHDGPWTKCNSWFEGDCGTWEAGYPGDFSYTTFAIRGVDKVGNAGYSTSVTVHYTWY